MKLISLISMLFLVGSTLAQKSPKIEVKGKVIGDEGETSFATLFVVNKRTRVGNFAEPNGSFQIKIRKNDTLLIGASGYKTFKLSFADSTFRDVYDVTVHLNKLSVQLKEVEVFAERDLVEIYKDIEKLGYDEKEYKVTGINALESPITALYASLSRRERKKREAYRLINEDKKRKLLKELFQQYVDHDIIQLKEDEFYEFINFCNVSEEFMQQSTQYEFIQYVKMKYRLYKEVTKYDDYERY